jgi:putative polyhydroxyalkanoate system protein
MPNMTATIPHQLTRAEAKRRIQDQIQTLRRQGGVLLTGLHDTWTGDRLDFSAAAMGQTLTGHLTVDDQAVHVEVALPAILAMLAGTVKQNIEQQGRLLLTKK